MAVYMDGVQVDGDLHLAWGAVLLANLCFVVKVVVFMPS